jgi:hypothetical protein
MQPCAQQLISPAAARHTIDVYCLPYDPQAVNTLVLGKTRAKQFYSDDAERTQSAAVLLHGDGAFSGQGIVFETLDLCGLFDYTVGGTIHLVVNNQVKGIVCTLLEVMGGAFSHNQQRQDQGEMLIRMGVLLVNCLGQPGAS